MFQPPCLCTQQVAVSDWVLLANSSAASTVPVASGLALVPVNKVFGYLLSGSGQGVSQVAGSEHPMR